MGSINLHDIARVLAERKQLQDSVAETFATTMFDVIRQALERDRVVKVKGLGTFKMIDVNARESINVNTGERVTIESHPKITFTPDAVMRDIVNKPFSQFETVVLNEGVEFDDMELQESDETPEPDMPDGGTFPYEAPTATEAATEQERPNSEDAPQETAEEKQDEPTPEEQEPTSNEPIEPVAEEQESAVEPDPAPAEASSNTQEDHAEQAVEPQEDDNAPKPEEQDDSATMDEEQPSESEKPQEQTIENESEMGTDYKKDNNEATPTEEQKSSNNVLTGILLSIVALAMLATSAFIGFLYGRYTSGDTINIATFSLNPSTEDAPLQTDPTTDAVLVPSDTIAAPVATDTVKAPTPTKPEPQSAPEKPTTTTTKAQQATTSSQTIDPTVYERMDVRVRTGAYRIIGTDRTVTVKPGETLRKISDTALGPGMECYIEVYNGLKASDPLQAGQKIKIPKLQLKKRSK